MSDEILCCESATDLSMLINIFGIAAPAIWWGISLIVSSDIPGVDPTGDFPDQVGFGTLMVTVGTTAFNMATHYFKKDNDAGMFKNIFTGTCLGGIFGHNDEYIARQSSEGLSLHVNPYQGLIDNNTTYSPA